MDELAKAKKRLADRIADVRVRIVPGLSDDLSAIMVAFDEIERRIGVLAVVAIKKHYMPVGASVHPLLWRALSEMGDHARAAYGIGEHGSGCICQECCLHRLKKG